MTGLVLTAFAVVFVAAIATLLAAMVGIPPHAAAVAFEMLVAAMLIGGLVLGGAIAMEDGGPAGMLIATVITCVLLIVVYTGPIHIPALAHA